MEGPTGTVVTWQPVEDTLVEGGTVTCIMRC